MLRATGQCAEEAGSPDRSTALLLLAARFAARDGGRACEVLARAGVAGEGVAAFLAAISLVRVATRDTVAFLPPSAPGASRDEELLIGAIAGLQRGAPWVAQRAFAEWLGPDLALRAIALLAKSAAAFARAGLRPPPVATRPPRSGLA